MKTWAAETWVCRRVEAQLKTGLPEEERPR
jgi:hypothetical protein